MNSFCSKNQTKSANKYSEHFTDLCSVERLQEDKGEVHQLTASSPYACELSNPLLENLPNKSKPIKIGPHWYPSSYVELYRPTGKYISRLLIRLFNAFSKKGIIRSIGNPCAPGLLFPELIPNKGMEQFEYLDDSCPIISVNILGIHSFPNSVTVRAEPFMILTLKPQWKQFDDYINAFSSKYRVRTKKIFSDTQHYTLQFLDSQDDPSWVNSCGDLLALSLRDKTLAIGRDLPKLLRCYKESLSEKFKVIGMFNQNKLIGFISFIIDDKKIFAMHLGLENNQAQHAQLYQRLLYEIVHEAFKRNVHFINFGRTGAEIKSTLGAVALENAFVVFTKSKLLLFLFRIYAKYFQKKYHHTFRSPFKNLEKASQS
jgi:hypothetical protein